MREVDFHDGDTHPSRQETDPEGDHSKPGAFPDAWEMRMPGLQRLAAIPDRAPKGENKRTRKARRKKLQKK